LKGIVVYDTKHGNTKLVAEKIVEGMMEVKEIEIAISEVKEVNMEEAADSDVLLIGSPNHVGKPVAVLKHLSTNWAKLI
jgi:NAD(P)H dehydrogenase (quinone)